MKERVLLVTNFSEASQNALNYACQLLDPDRYEFVLVHIYRLPQLYTIEGVALAGISDTLRDIEEALNGELERVKNHFPATVIRGQYILGGLIESSRELIATLQPAILIFGTAGYYSEVWHTDSELLLALRNLPIPVLIIPQHIRFQPLRQIGFACDYKNLCVPRQVDFIRTLVRQTNARLKIVHVTRSKPDTEKMRRNEALLHDSLQEIQPQYFSIEKPAVIKAIDEFVQTQQLDLLIVIPRKHEFWYGLFHKNNIDQLAFLNRLPILALPE